MKVYPFVAAEKPAERNVNRSCGLLSVSRSAYYDWSRHTPSAHTWADEAVRLRIRRIHTESRGTYGAPRVHQQLRQEGVHTARKRVARDFAAADRPLNHAWVGDITYIRTWQGWAYLATVIDLASRRVVGFAVAESFFATLKTELIYRQALATIPAARSAVFEYIEVFYNRRRLHSALGYQSPSTYEACTLTQPTTAPAA